MTAQVILAEKTVSATDVRKQPCLYFRDEPIAVLSHNKTAGYMVGADLFEAMVRRLEDSVPTVQSVFNPSNARLKEIAASGAKALDNATREDLSDFDE